MGKCNYGEKCKFPHHQKCYEETQYILNGGYDKKDTYNQDYAKLG